MSKTSTRAPAPEPVASVPPAPMSPTPMPPTPGAFTQVLRPVAASGGLTLVSRTAPVAPAAPAVSAVPDPSNPKE